MYIAEELNFVYFDALQCHGKKTKERSLLLSRLGWVVGHLV
jgi:hypothetical protein